MAAPNDPGKPSRRSRTNGANPTPLGAQAETFPSRQVTIIVPFAAGGPSDVIARLIGEQMSKRLGQPFINEVVAGAAGTIGTTRAARASAPSSASPSPRWAGASWSAAPAAPALSFCRCSWRPASRAPR